MNLLSAKHRRIGVVASLTLTSIPFLSLTADASFGSRTSTFSLVASAVQIAGSIVVNGDFEEPYAGPNWTTYEVGMDIGGWTVSSGTVDVKVDVIDAAHGHQSVDLSGYNEGAVYQDLVTEAGRKYTLRFYMSGNPGEAAVIRSMEVWWDGQLVDTPSVDMTGRTPDNMMWELREYDGLQASSATTRLEFVSLVPGFYGPTIDLVIVVPMGDVALDSPTELEGDALCATFCNAHHRRPLVNADGTQIVFSSLWDPQDAAGNPELNREIFRYDFATDVLIQDTDTIEGFSVPQDFVGDEVLAFSTSPDMPNNADTNSDLFVVDIATPDTFALTDTTGPAATTHFDAGRHLDWFLPEEINQVANLNADFSSDGRYVVWASNRSISSFGAAEGANGDGNYEIYWYDRNLNETRQLTVTTGGDDESPAGAANLWPRVSADGARVVFASNRPLDGASVTAGRYALFMIDGAKAVQRLVNATFAVSREFPAFGMDSSGGIIAFASDADLVAQNPDLNLEIYTLDIDEAPLTQITDTKLSALSQPVVNHRPILSGDGLKIAFLSNADFGDLNGDGSEDLWVYHFERDVQYVRPFVQVTDVQETPEALNEREHWLDWHHFDETGSRLVWTANADLLGMNTDGTYQVYDASFTWEPKLVLTDVNNDGSVNAIDIQLVINTVLGLNTGYNADVNDDGAENAADVQTVINAALGVGL